jgi:hypothetical protein
MLMKKVRYAIGALGAVPALGLLAPAANAATAATHAPKPAGKTVSLRHAGAPAITCGHTANNGNFALGVSGHIGYQQQCIHSQVARIFARHTGLAERVRMYNTSGRRLFQTFIGGHLGANSTHWSSFPNIPGVHQVCQAIVANGNHSNVVYGPVCENT